MSAMQAAKGRTLWTTVVAVALLVVATTWPAAAKTVPAAGAAGNSSPLLAAVVGLEVGQILEVGATAGVELALAAPRTWTYLADLERFTEDAKWRLEVAENGLLGSCPEPFARLKTRVKGYQQSGGGNKAVKISLSPCISRTYDDSSTALLMRGLLITADPLGYVDGPSMYAFAGFDPINQGDPMGLELIQKTLTQTERDEVSANAVAIRAKERAARLAADGVMVGSYLRADGIEPTEASQREWYEAAKKYYKQHLGIGTADAAYRAHELAGRPECTDNSVLCAGENGGNWKRAKQASDIMAVPVGLSTEFLFPMAFPGGSAGAAGFADDLVRHADDFVDEAAAAANGSTKLLAPPKTARHHIFNKFRGSSPKSQKYRDFFKKHDIDVDNFTVEIPEAMHRGVIHTAGNNWTTRWKRWIDANPNATTKDVYQFSGELMDEYGISNLDLIHYRTGVPSS